METLVSSLYNDQSMPENYVFPPETRPREAIVPVSKNIPIIDLGKSVVGHDHRNNIVQQILNAAQEFGFFQVISNGKLRSAEYRAVTNSRNARTTIVTFINPSFSRIIEPAKALVNECKPRFIGPSNMESFSTPTKQ